MKTPSTPKYLQFILLPLFVFFLNVGWGQLLSENFSYTTVGNITTATANWTAHSGTTFYPQYTNAGLTFSGHAGNSVGGAVSIATNGVADVNRTFTSQNSGTVYMSCLVNITSATGADYFLHFNSGTFNARVLATNSGGNLRFGISKAGTPTAATTNFSFGTTYMLVIKYTFISGGTTNDQCDLWVMPAFAATEAAAGSALQTTTTGTDATALNAVAIRQGTPPAGTIDAIIVGTTWNQVAPASVNPTISFSGTISELSTIYGTASSYTSFSVSGVNMSSGISVNPPTGFQVSTTSDFSSNVGSNGAAITVGSSGTITSIPIYVRLAASTAVGNYSGNIVLSSTGATSVNVATVSSAVSAKALTITGLSGTNKVYDGTTTASFTGTAAYNGLVNGESFAVTGTPSPSFATAAVGTGKTITVTGYTAPSTNYSISQPTGLTADITAKSLTLTANNITKTEGATLTGGAGSTAFTSSGLVVGESIGSVTITYGTGASASDAAGTYVGQVTPSLATGGSFSASNYSITYVNGNIIVEAAPASPTITVSGTLSALSTTYGTPSSTTSFTVSGAAMTSGITIAPPTGFEVATTSDFSSTIGTTSSPLLIGSAGTIANTTIYVRIRAVASVADSPYSGNISLTSAGASDQSIAISSSVVNTKPVTITGISGVSKIYDGTTTASLTGTAVYDGLANNEIISVTGTPSASFANKTVGTAKTVTITGYNAPSSNYTLTQPSATADITALSLTVTGAAVSSKTYDGTTSAIITGSTLVGVISPDVVTISTTGTFASANAGIGVAVTSTQTLGGADAGNYTLTLPTGLAADITKADQTITFNALVNKTTADLPFALTATASSSLPVTYTSSNTAVATISGNTVTIVGAGTTTITAYQAGNENYNAATSVSQSLVVTLAPVTLALWNFGTASSGSAAAGNVPANISISTIASGNSFGTTTMLGTTSASNNSGASGSYNAGVAANVGPLNIASTTNAYFEFTLTPATGYYFSLTNISFGSRSTGTGPITYSVRSSVNSYATDLATGSLSNSSSWASYSTSAINSISAVQTGITYRIYGYNGTGSPGSGSINWRIDDLSLSGNVILGATPPTLTADATSNTVDNNIDITHTAEAAWTNAITAVKIGASTLTPTTDYIISSGNIQLLPSGGNSLLTTAGTKTITIVASGYTNATVSQVINAGTPTSNSTATINSLLSSGATRTITCTAKDQYNNLVSGYTFTYDATLVTANATTTESYSLDGSAVTSSVNNVSLSSTTNASGVATFTIVMPSALDEADGISIQVQLANGSTNIGYAFTYYELPGQTITFNGLNAVTYGDAAFTVSAFGGASDNPVVFTSSNNAVATCTGTNGSTITIIGAGTASISANQAGNAGYNAAAEVSQTLVVNQKGLTISGVGAADKVYNGSSAAVITGTPAYVGLVNGETFSVTGTGVATFSDAEAGVGKTVNFSGYTAPTANYSLTQPTTTASISQAAQTILFSSLPNRFVGAPAFTLTQNATSGLAITYSSSNTSVATIVGNTVTPVGAGTTTITATQAGNNNYAAAPTLTQDLTVIATPIAGWDFFGQTSPTTFAATTFNSNLDGTSGLSNITRGAGALVQSTPPSNSFSTTGFQNNGISVSNTDYFQVTLKANNGYSLSLSEINANFDGTASFYAAPGVTSQYAYSIDGTNFTLIGDPVTSTSLKPAAVDLTGVSALQNLIASTTVTIRYYASGQTTSGGWRFSSPSAGVLGLAIGGSLCQLPEQLSLSSSSFCNNGETAVISSTISETGMTYELYDANGAVSNSSKSGTGSALSWTGLNSGVYYVVGTNNLGGCTTTSSSITLTATVPSYSYYPDTDGDGYGAGTAVLSCSASTPANYSTLSTDCNDNNAAIRPNATEVCGDGIDNNCDNNETYPNQYRSAVESGDWSVASTWEKSCSEGIWEAALIAPSNQYFNASTPFAVTIQSGNSVTVSTTSTTNFAKAGSLTVAGNLIVNGNLTVTSSVINSGTVTINHGASFVQTNQVVGNNNSGNGNFIVNMNLTGTNNNTAPNGRYWYLGSPMNNTVASLFFDQPKMVRLWSYEPSNNSWVTLINSSTTPSGATNSTVLVPGLGYLYRAGFDKTIQFVGDATKFNNNITTPLALTGAGYKYVANPYTSHIDWRQVTRTGLNVSYWIRNATNTAYEAYNATSGVSTPSGTQTTQFIPPMQGFWVYAFTTSSSLRIDNGDRTHSTNGLHAPQHNQIVRLNLNDGKTDDQAVVYENENASNGIEEYDTDKFMDESHHQVYFLEGTKQLTLDGLKDATAKQKVDMGIQITAAGTYTINAVELGVEEDVMLEDKFTHTFQDLKRNNTYSFTSNAGTYNNRFVLHFTLNPQTETAIETETVGVGETVGETDGVSVYTTTGQQVKVWVTNTVEFQNATVKVYDAIGNMIERKNMTSNELLLDLNTATGVYLVEVTGAEKTFTKKVFIAK